MVMMMMRMGLGCRYLHDLQGGGGALLGGAGVDEALGVLLHALDNILNLPRVDDITSV